MKLAGWILGILALALGTAWAAGVRVHPEKVLQKMNRSKRTQVEIELRNGQKVSGALIREDPDRLEIDLEGAGVVFKRSEIRRLKLTGAGSSAAGSGSASWQGMVTYNRRDNLWVRWHIWPDFSKRSPDLGYGTGPKVKADPKRLVNNLLSKKAMRDQTNQVIEEN